MELRKDIEAILFDLDGTIFHLNVDWQDLKAKLNQAILNDSDSISYNNIVQLTKTSEEHKYLEQIINKAEIDGVDAGAEIKRSGKVLANIKKKYQVAIVTRNSRYAAQKVLDILGLRNIPIIGREDVSLMKPHPEALEIALKILKTSPSKAIMVGDTFHDIHAAHQLGMVCVVVNNPRNSYRPEGGDYYVDQLTELEDLLMNKKGFKDARHKAR